MFIVSHLFVSVGSLCVVSDASLSLKAGQITVLMGPNGSGKSSLLQALAGHPSYVVTQGTITFNEKECTQWSSDKRAREGLFLSIQNPHALPGITVSTLLRESFRAINSTLSLREYDKRLSIALKILRLEDSFLARSVNEGFSGGEKKRCEVLQLLVLQPKVILLDEIDSGLDVDALKDIGKALNNYRNQYPETALLVVTHYQNILEYLSPDVVHVMHEGKIVFTGDKTILPRIEKDGYDQFKTA